MRVDELKKYKRKELMEIAKRYGIRLTKIPPLKGYKTMKKLIEDIIKHELKQKPKKENIEKRIDILQKEIVKEKKKR